MSPVDLDGLRSAFAVKALTALDDTASRCGPGRPMDTLSVVLTLKTVDVGAEWDRISLVFGEIDPATADRYADPVPRSGDSWMGAPVTGTCATAIRAAVVLADGSGMLPVPPGVLALCLLGEPGTAASLALAGSSPAAYAVLLQLAQEALVGGSWEDIQSVLTRCFEAAAAAGPLSGMAADDDAELAQFAADVSQQLADRFAELVDVVNEFLRADTAAESGSILDQHPELLERQVDDIIAKSIQGAVDAGDQEGSQKLRDKRRFLDNYRRLAGVSIEERDVSQRFGECRPGQHSWEGSSVSRPGCQATAVRCEVFHVGHLLEMSTLPGGEVKVDYFIFPADGYDTISQEVIMWAVAVCEGTIRQMEEDGVPVRRGTPAVGLRPDSLALHTDFRPIR